MTGLFLVAARPETQTSFERLPLRDFVEALIDRVPDVAAAHLPTKGEPAKTREGRTARTDQMGVVEPIVRTRTVLPDVAYALSSLASGVKSRAVVRLCVEPDPWELGMERAGGDVLVTVFRSGDLPDVLVHERRMKGAEFAARVLALGTNPNAAPRVANDDARRTTAEGLMAQAMNALSTSLPFAPVDDAVEAAAVSVEPTGDLPIVMSAEVLLRAPEMMAESAAAVQRADLFALLFRGKLRVTVGEHARDVPDVFVFPLAEQLVAMTQEMLEAWVARRSFHRRFTACGAVLGLRLDAEHGAAYLTLGSAKRAAPAQFPAWTFPALDVGALVQSIAAFGRALSRSLVRRSRAHASNLLLIRFRARVRELLDGLKEISRNDSKINPAPEVYRAFAVAHAESANRDAPLTQARLRYATRWTAAIASIDLRATFLCGEVLVVGATREVVGLDRRTGQVLWQRPVPRAVSVMTPRGLARIEPDGAVRLFDITSGEAVWSTRVEPRPGASTSGAVISAPRLPPTLILSEGAKHLVALDLPTGQIAWRYAARRGSFFRLKRAGKLVIVSNGEPALTALDVTTGDVVWRFCDRLRFASQVATDHDALFAYAGDGALVGRGGARLYQLDPWSGASRFAVDLPKQLNPVGAPLITPETVVVVGHGRRGTELSAFDRATGELRWTQNACPTAASCLAVDQTVVVNSEGGELIAFDAATGATRYRHVFGTGPDGDRPRRLEPVLRSGALFVPQNEVYVVRPQDGTLLGQVKTDLIPDLLRVDEKCDLYVAEESGHVGAFASGPRLALVR
ncbi:MAG: PQQ-binding-like beta-propeller repeat protein [Polyangiaceae bacterium]|nr:PQQ-binding-like beta-propeller repeat protein [Polyangiaceae bacterium]